MRTIQVSAAAILFIVFPNLSFAQPKPALRDVREVSVVVTISDSEPNKFGLNPVDLKSRVIDKLSDANLKVIEPTNPLLNVPELRISLDMLKLESCGQCVIIVRTALSRLVNLNLMSQDEILSYGADVWKIDSGIQAVAADDVPEKANAIVQEQVNAFITARPPMVSAQKQPGVNQSGAQSSKPGIEKGTNPVKQQAVEAKFVASKNSQVFHKASCPSAQRISAKNLVSYATRDEAIAAGKRPCERCNP
jgi:hypothetical protein